MAAISANNIVSELITLNTFSFIPKRLYIIKTFIMNEKSNSVM